jgi:hypothetical protein
MVHIYTVNSAKPCLENWHLPKALLVQQSKFFQDKLKYDTMHHSFQVPDDRYDTVKNAMDTYIEYLHTGEILCGNGDWAGVQDYDGSASDQQYWLLARLFVLA